MVDLTLVSISPQSKEKARAAKLKAIRALQLRSRAWKATKYRLTIQGTTNNRDTIEKPHECTASLWHSGGTRRRLLVLRSNDVLTATDRVAQSVYNVSERVVVGDAQCVSVGWIADDSAQVVNVKPRADSNSHDADSCSTCEVCFVLCGSRVLRVGVADDDRNARHSGSGRRKSCRA